jgi:hypothetical protein
MAGEWQIIKDLYKGFGNNPRNAETFEAIANMNPLFSAYRGAKTLANVDVSPMRQSLLNEAYGISDPNVNRQAANQVKDTLFGLLDVAPTFPVAKAGAKGLLKVTENLPAGMSIKDVGKKLTPFEEAFNLAQQRAALPVSEGGLGLPATNTAMDRAKAMGYNTKAYTGANIEGEIESVLPKSWFSKEPEYSSRYSNVISANGISKDPRVYPVLLKTGKTEVNPMFGLYEDMEKALSKKKTDTFKVEGVGGGSNDFYVTKNPNQVRSINAAFDPFRRNEPDLLAGVAAAPAGLLAIEEEKPKKKRSNK